MVRAQPKVVAELLDKISNPKIKGFSVNSCNYRSTRECIKWSRKILKYRERDHFVIDTSRNGQGPNDNEWCNPSGRGLGEFPQYRDDLIQNVMLTFGLRYQENQMVSVMVDLRLECFGENRLKN